MASPPLVRWSRLTRWLFAASVLSLFMFISIEPWLRSRWVEETLLMSNEDVKVSTSREFEDLQSTVQNMSDVALMLKTGSSTIWRRLPAHLLTTFADNRVPNFAIYSDAVESLPHAGSTIDTIANVSLLIQKYDPEAYSVYSRQLRNLNPNLYNEQAGLPGDTGPKITENGNPEGWNLDRWKFLPMLFHAHTTWPEVKWYVYIEDDTYLFSRPLLQWLARKSYNNVAYYGFSVGPPGAKYAQGGSGMIFSQSLIKNLFKDGLDPVFEKYGPMTSESCCGDVALGKIFRDMGIDLNEGVIGDAPLFQGEPPWRVDFKPISWCSPVITFHHLHQQDIANLANIEHNITQTNGSEVLFSDIYMTMISPYLQKTRVSGWDNYADEYLIGQGRSLSEDLSNLEIDFPSVLESPDGCGKACENFSRCLSWRFEKDSCGLTTGMKLGRETNLWEYGNRTVVSGWMLSRFHQTVLSTSCGTEPQVVTK